MRIWLAPSAYFPHRGGVEELTAQLAIHLTDRHHDVLIVAPRHPADLPAYESREGVDVARIDFYAPRRSAASLVRFTVLFPVHVAKIACLMRRHRRPDVVHIQCPSVQGAAITAFCALFRIPLVLTSQGETKMDAHNIYGTSAFMRGMLRWCARRASALTACSGWTAEAAGEIAPEFVEAVVIPNGVDPDQWIVTSPVREPVVCAWGRHVPQKGFDLLIAAFEAVKREFPTAELLIGGLGSETEKLRAVAGSGVTFVGPLDRQGVHDLLSRSRIATVPSRLEPFGIVALEAMATGRAVVWSTVGGLSDATSGLGWGVDPSDTEALGRALIAALRAEPDPDTMRAAAETLSWDRVVESYLAVYDGCVRA